MSERCQAEKPSDCHRNYCVRNNECADRAASAPAMRAPGLDDGLQPIKSLPAPLERAKPAEVEA